MKKPPKKNRGRPISLRLLPEELEAFQQAASREHDNLSNWIRRTLLAAAKGKR